MVETKRKKQSKNLFIATCLVLAGADDPKRFSEVLDSWQVKDSRLTKYSYLLTFFRRCGKKYQSVRWDRLDVYFSGEFILLKDFILYPGASVQLICYLLLSEKDPHRNTSQREILPELIFQVIFIRLLDIVGEVAEKSKRRNGDG